MVEQVAGKDLYVVDDVLDSLVHFGAGASRHADDAIAFLQQELGEIRAVLAGDSGDECGFLQYLGCAEALAQTLRERDRDKRRDFAREAFRDRSPHRIQARSPSDSSPAGRRRSKPRGRAAPPPRAARSRP